MTTAIDTNILVALWDKDEPLSPAVWPALDAALGRGSLVVAARRVRGVAGLSIQKRIFSRSLL